MQEKEVGQDEEQERERKEALVDLLTGRTVPAKALAAASLTEQHTIFLESHSAAYSPSTSYWINLARSLVSCPPAAITVDDLQLYPLGCASWSATEPSYGDGYLPW